MKVRKKNWLLLLHLHDKQKQIYHVFQEYLQQVCHRKRMQKMAARLTRFYGYRISRYGPDTQNRTLNQLSYGLQMSVLPAIDVVNERAMWILEDYLRKTSSEHEKFMIFKKWGTNLLYLRT
jgi:Zn-dependent M32 family carboxypeptidase